MCSVEGLYQSEEVFSKIDGVIERINRHVGAAVDVDNVLMEYKGANMYQEIRQFQ